VIFKTFIQNSKSKEIGVQLARDDEDDDGEPVIAS